MSKVEKTIINKLSAALKPRELQVLNESYMHSVPENSETHFKVTVVSDEFDNLRSVQRHQKIYQILAEELAGPIHALALHTYSPKEWSQQPQVAKSPDCAGAAKHS